MSQRNFLRLRARKFACPRVHWQTVAKRLCPQLLRLPLGHSHPDANIAKIQITRALSCCAMEFEQPTPALVFLFFQQRSLKFDSILLAHSIFSIWCTCVCALRQKSRRRTIRAHCHRISARQRGSKSGFARCILSCTTHKLIYPASGTRLCTPFIIVCNVYPSSIRHFWDTEKWKQQRGSTNFNECWFGFESI